MYRNSVIEMSGDQNSQTEMAKTELARPKQPDRKIVYLKYLPIMFQHLYLHSFVLHKKQGTNPYFYNLLQSQKSLNTIELA